ncbi:MAG TPA: penicillin-binding protein [Candidatus Binatia bacterium]|nr:penicillin-binding protein [Candidatus Binatia bacterium]
MLFLWVAAVLGRLVYLQVVKYRFFLNLASRQRGRVLDVDPRRGTIYDRNGTELAMSIDVDSVFAVPSEIPDQETTSQILANVLGLDAQELLLHLRSQKNFAWVKRKVDAETGERVRALNLRGIYFRKEPKRFYPKRDLAAQVIGYVGTDDEGLGGLELVYDDDLRGIPGREIIEVDARRKWFGRVERQPDPGQNLVLTVDGTIQYIVEKELEQAMQDTGAAAGTVVVQNPHTGEILALANRPTFNPNVFNSVPKEALKNRAVSDVYEPGSVFKTVTYSAAIEQGVVKPEDMVDCQGGAITVFGMTIHDAHKMGVMTIAEAYAHSSDVAAIKTGMKLGDTHFDEFIRAYGFGKQTGIELPGESRGLKKPVTRWSKVSIASMSMGQEIGVTAVQVVSMVSTIANDGLYTPPRVVAGELPPNAGPKPVVFHPPQQHRVISTLTAVKMKKMMESVVLDGTARRAILDGYTVAGKTGTAQKVDPATGAYSKTKYVASFVGFAPVNNPAITIAVILDSAQGLHQGGQVSAPVFRSIAQQVLEYMHVPHDIEPKNQQRLILLASTKNDDLAEEGSDRLGFALLTDNDDATATETASNSPAESAAIGIIRSAKQLTPVAAVASEPVASATAPPAETATGTVQTSDGTVILNVDSGIVVPSFMGKSLRASIETAQQSGLEINALGSGIARQQSPPPGTHLLAGQKVTVRFSH